MTAALVPEISRHFAGQARVAAEIRRRAAVGEELDLLAVRGLGLIALNDSLLRSWLDSRDKPLRARILLLDPDCDAAGQRAAEIGESPATFTAGIKYTLARLEEVAAAATGLDLEVRLYTRLPVWRILRVDQLMWVGSFAAAWEGHESTMHELVYSERGSLWQGFRRQIDDLFAHARRVI
ncbi:hypothetical protein GCM10010112_26240 [Actinoplanes lobatus]|uniref:Uncharacterized protein n=1 Tax=Actinoplanes lobatus TaxID=113568 RepID=A0A7W7MJ50_9ACTN|nr:hypothetical protein [Actinoplanes lobatus]MBB4751665.1 hypothetical protein [Actinoplanes lobatus]GGN65200.1 hypothetical protein GCM10010112_26240 [Actinoplanes lobatus]